MRSIQIVTAVALLVATVTALPYPTLPLSDGALQTREGLPLGGNPLDNAGNDSGDDDFCETCEGLECLACATDYSGFSDSSDGPDSSDLPTLIPGVLEERQDFPLVNPLFGVFPSDSSDDDNQNVDEFTNPAKDPFGA